MGVETSEQSQDSSGSESGVDVNALMEDMRQQFEAPLTESRREVADLRDGHKRTNQVLENIRRAVAGDEKPADADPADAKIAHYQQQIDQYIAAAVQAERQGRPIPLTVNAAIESLQGLIAQTEENKLLRQRLGKMEGQVARVSDPGHSIDMQAYSSIDSQVQNALNTIYGKGDEYSDVKSSQFQAITGMIIKEVRDLKENEPDVWERIRRNSSDQKALVNHFVKAVIPPRARQLMEEEDIRTTPLTLGDLKQAWEEAKDIKDPTARSEIQSRLRPQILSMVYARGKKGGGKGGANDVF